MTRSRLIRVDPRDSRSTSPPRKTHARAAAQARPGSVVFHSGGLSARTQETIGTLIRNLTFRPFL
jgi:hypothetical protein